MVKVELDLIGLKKNLHIICLLQIGVKGNPQHMNRGLDCDVIVAEVSAVNALLKHTKSELIFNLTIIEESC